MTLVFVVGLVLVGLLFYKGRTLRVDRNDLVPPQRRPDDPGAGPA